MSNVIVGGNLIAVATGGALLTVPLARTVSGSQRLQRLPSTVIKEYMIQEGIGLITDPSDSDDWPLYQTHFPSGNKVNKDMLCIYDTVGLNDQRGMNGKVNQHPGIQLRLRSRNNEVGFVKLEEIASLLDEVINGNITIGALEYEIQNISRASQVISLGVNDEKRRFEFTVNFLTTIRELTS